MQRRRIVALAQHQQFLGLLQADQVRQDGRDAAGDEQAPGHFREETARALGPDREVAIERPFEAAADRPAVDRADHRHIAIDDGARDVLDGLRPRARRGFASRDLPRLEVRARAEGPSRAPEDDGARPDIGVGVPERLRQRGDQGVVNRVQRLRPVEHDMTHRALLFGQHDGPSCGHGLDLLVWPAIVSPSAQENAPP